jgi:hypothetical protein
MGIQPAVVGAAQRAEGSEFKHDRLLKRFVMGCEWLTPDATPVVYDGHHLSVNNR